jgi:hypothetical protein
MALFGNQPKNNRVYLRRKSLKLQSYVSGGIFLSIVTLGVYIFFHRDK